MEGNERRYKESVGAKRVRQASGESGRRTEGEKRREPAEHTVTVYGDNGLTVLTSLRLPPDRSLAANELSAMPEIYEKDYAVIGFYVIPGGNGELLTHFVPTCDCSVFLRRRCLLPDERVYRLLGDLRFYKCDLWGKKRLPSLVFEKAEETNVFRLEADLYAGDRFKIASLSEGGQWDNSSVLDAENLSPAARRLMTCGDDPFGTGANVAVTLTGRYRIEIVTDLSSRRRGQIDCTLLGKPSKRLPPPRKYRTKKS